MQSAIWYVKSGFVLDADTDQAIRRRVTDLVGHVLGSGRVDGVTAQAVPADALPGHPAEWAVDDVRGRGFATRWISGSSGDPKVACASATPAPATASSPALTFRQPTNVREIGIEAGLPAPRRKAGRASDAPGSGPFVTGEHWAFVSS